MGNQSSINNINISSTEDIIKCLDKFQDDGTVVNTLHGTMPFIRKIIEKSQDMNTSTTSDQMLTSIFSNVSIEGISRKVSEDYIEHTQTIFNVEIARSTLDLIINKPFCIDIPDIITANGNLFGIFIPLEQNPDTGDLMITKDNRKLYVGPIIQRDQISDTLHELQSRSQHIDLVIYIVVWILLNDIDPSFIKCIAHYLEKRGGKYMYIGYRINENLICDWIKLGNFDVAKYNTIAVPLKDYVARDEIPIEFGCSFDLFSSTLGG